MGCAKWCAASSYASAGADLSGGRIVYLPDRVQLHPLCGMCQHVTLGSCGSLRRRLIEKRSCGSLSQRYSMLRWTNGFVCPCKYSQKTHQEGKGCESKMLDVHFHQLAFYLTKSCAKLCKRALFTKQMAVFFQGKILRSRFGFTSRSRPFALGSWETIPSARAYAGRKSPLCSRSTRRPLLPV